MIELWANEGSIWQNSDKNRNPKRKWSNYRPKTSKIIKKTDKLSVTTLYIHTHAHTPESINILPIASAGIQWCDPPPIPSWSRESRHRRVEYLNRWKIWRVSRCMTFYLADGSCRHAWFAPRCTCPHRSSSEWCPAPGTQINPCVPMNHPKELPLARQCSSGIALAVPLWH